VSRLGCDDTRGDFPVERADIREISALLGLEGKTGDAYLAALPFAANDTTAGSESEYQTAVEGSPDDTDLPAYIRSSKYYSNITRRVQTGELQKNNVHRIDEFLLGNTDGVWENSWVRFPYSRLKASTRDAFMRDLAADKRDPAGPLRPDFERFFLEKNKDRWVRVPLSYLLKLALIDALAPPETDPLIRSAAESLKDNFLNDNSSPETFSFYPCTGRPGEGPGKNLAGETLLRFLLSQFAVMYANRAFGLEANGQKAVLYFAPTTPVRMRRLNTIIADSFYREIFMSPCLSGWDRGYEKHQYMHLCHRVLSRSHLNSVFKLKESGILSGPLVRLEAISNTSLANNGTHVSLGSRVLSGLSRTGIYTAAHEKSVGDLTIKIFEHFLPLFPGLYSTSPWRLDYRDMRPENVAGFLAHELTNTHLRMLWRRWIKQAGMVVLGRSIIPNGPEWYERLWCGFFNISGSMVPDGRLTDYFVALLSTPESPALSGRLGNDIALKRDLADQGVFDESMSVYLPVKLREFRRMGFSGFEGRYYSVFDSLLSDMADAVDLQHLITAYAYKLALEGRVSHGDIPDDQFTESERRQIFFASAMGICTVNIRRENPNRFMEGLITLTLAAKPSKRYSGYRKVKVHDYRLALLALLRSDPALLESLKARELLDRCEDRIRSADNAESRIVSGILKETGKKPLSLKGEDFNRRTEAYYRGDLKHKNISEALQVLTEELEVRKTQRPASLNGALRAAASGLDPAAFVHSKKEKILSDTLSIAEVVSLLSLTALHLNEGKSGFAAAADKELLTDAPIYR
jgi:hypothetical protein